MQMQKKECADFLSIVKGGDRRIGKVDAQGGLFGEQYELLVNILKPQKNEGESA